MNNRRNQVLIVYIVFIALLALFIHNDLLWFLWQLGCAATVLTVNIAFPIIQAGLAQQLEHDLLFAFSWLLNVLIFSLLLHVNTHSPHYFLAIVLVSLIALLIQAGYDLVNYRKR
ncbi:hypothetical protein OKIT_0798 [Oenococcus kitaharae DSM 17330]|uniref:Uncharacterized protein n=1 Tax=Oenococcus kitaharae DSM 17330 TaxID=1045004 RepID=G9WI22_9LACO|nr:hypothetical protein OKIT_0798 [Oenococcus kitaharae DSM 17330]OEY81774.1 hypothetical protein NT96_08370 [Oenococcus kitaharae]OEY84005.1 hypothetical protein NT95_02430 [Oenococcus kitaharae]OEY85639.1 hypothetical protein NV75_04005 [Oenococcus kitaharae]